MNKDKRIFYTAVISFFVVAVSILLMPYSSDEAQAGNNEILYALGGSFWTFLILGYLMVIILLFRTKKKKSTNVKIKAGIFGFFTNRPAFVFDGILIVSSILFLICMLLMDRSNYVICILLATLFLSLHMHFLLNSKMYYVIKNVK